MSGNFLVEQFTDADGASLTRIGATNVSLKLGPEVTPGNHVVELNQGSGTFLITTAGVAARIEGAISINAPGIDSLAAVFTVAISTLSTSVNETFRINGEDIVLDLPAGPYVKVEALDVVIAIGGQELSGDFAFEQTTLTDGTQAVRLGVANVELTLGDPAAGALELSNGQGSLLVLPTGCCRQLHHRTLRPDPWRRTAGAQSPSNSTRPASRSPTRSWLATRLSPCRSKLAHSCEVVIRDGELDVFGQTLSGNFAFESTPDGVAIAATNVELDLGDGLVVVSGGTGAFVITAAGFAGAFSGALAFGVSDISVSANLAVEINTTGLNVNRTIAGTTLALGAGQYVRVVGSAASKLMSSVS